MPSLEQIKTFDQTLTTLGNEPEILKSWGEPLEPAEPPPEHLSDDISTLLGEQDEAAQAELDDFNLDEEVEEPVLEGEDFLEAFASSQAQAESDDIGEIDELDGAGELGEVDELDGAGELGEVDELGSDEELPELEDDFAFDIDEDVPEQAAPEAAGVDEDADAEELSEEVGEEDEAPDDFDLDEFSLGDFGAEFGVQEDEEFAPSEADILPEQELEEGEQEAASDEESEAAAFALTDEQFAAMQRTLSRLPLNVKTAAEQAIAQEYGSSGRRQRLIELLVAGESVKGIADFAGRLVGKRLEVPKNYRKLSGLAFEQEKDSFAYRFRHQILPVLRVAVLAAVAIILVSMGVYQFVYRPIHARSLFRQGYELISRQQYEQANRVFDEAFDTWPVHRWIFSYPVRRWFYRYADAFTAERQFALAAQKYDKLLSAYPMDKGGILGYAELESAHRTNYERAEELLKSYRETVELYDYDILVASGDNYMRWAEIETGRYEDARMQFATAIQQHGDTDELLMRMLLYFIRTDNRREVEPLRRLFQDDLRTEIDPYIYAELGGYLIDYDDLDEVRNILFRALAEDDQIPEPHYHLARYYRRLESLSEEERALRNTLTVLDRTEPLTPRRLALQVDTHGRLGEFYYDRGEYITAEDKFLDGIRAYESAVGQGLLSPERRFGRLYARLGDIYYYIAREYGAALDQFRRAEANAYSSRELHYKKGYIQYRGENWDAALESFLEAAGSFSANRNILYATANAFYSRGNYHSAEGLYKDLLERVERDRGEIDAFLIDEDPEHRSLLEYRIRVRNNLGVTQNRLGDQLGDPHKASRGMVYLTESNELAENYGRDPETAARAATTGLAELNLREVLYPRPQYELQIYRSIPRDLEDLQF